MNNKKTTYLITAILLTFLILTACRGAGTITYTSGTFEGIGEGGHYGPISVAVTIDDDGRITDVEVTDHIETPHFAERAFGYLIPAVLEAQSADVDAIAGATATSNAFIKAVEDALNNAQ